MMGLGWFFRCRLHNRMPVILPDKDAEEAWLANGEVDTKYGAARPTVFA